MTLFPDFFESPLKQSILGRAIEDGHVNVDLVDIRDFAENKHDRVDDKPYGGGAGMVMQPGPVVRAIESESKRLDEPETVLLTPQGQPLKQSRAETWADGDSDLILVCARYEGIDERVREGWIDTEISIGDYVLSGGEPAALVVVDAVARLVPGVLGNCDSLETESFQRDRLEYPQYTRPREFRDREVPEVLLSGDHERIEQWRRDRSEQRTQNRRSDLIEESEEES